MTSDASFGGLINLLKKELNLASSRNEKKFSQDIARRNLIFLVQEREEKKATGRKWSTHVPTENSLVFLDEQKKSPSDPGRGRRGNTKA